MATTDDHRLASELAASTGSLLTELRQRLVDGGSPPPVLRHEGDRKAHEYLIAALARERPGDGVLSEEGVASDAHPDRSSATRVWIIDPLDGTREFGEPSRTDWAVHIALAEDGLPTAGAVALPALELTVSTAEPPSSTALPPVPDRPRVVVSRTRPASEAVAVAEALGADLMEMGSAGAKAMAVVRGEADAYLHTGGQYEWDSCAPVAVALAAGLHATRIDGSPLEYNRSEPYIPNLVICRQELAEPIVNILASHA
ncbi:MAG: 3'(2'),5'-bisphosphate nucleotidase CysQ [Actinomycetota bacterium]|nr:3'(2'),5'-bisphosphate nucleotidase CysQ [Actinomycetota bacterium]